MALALRPKLLLLDEPTAGMSPEETYQTGELILRLNASGTTLLVVEHDMTFVRQIAKVVTVLHFGRVFARGSINEVIMRRTADVLFSMERTSRRYRCASGLIAASR